MAVVQISRIQIRRGKKDGPREDGVDGWTGVKLASAEMAWCVDSQQLYIGNGETSEGAPAAGNTEILTSRNNLIDIALYQYGRVNINVTRNLQQRLDERVNAESFGVVPVLDGDIGVATQTNRTHAIQTAINKLYFDSLQNSGNPNIRAVLEFGPGVFLFNHPIYIHSYAHIVGAGQGRTIFKYTGTGSAFRLTNDHTYVDDSSVPTSTGENQCRSVILKNFSIQLDSNNTTALLLESVKDSEFNNIDISSTWNGQYDRESIAMQLLANTELITCKNNTFDHITIKNFKIGIESKYDILNNLFKNCLFENLETAVNFGQGTDLLSNGQKYGPRNNIITECVFNRTSKQGIKIYNGTGNISSQNKFTLVGDRFGSIDDATYGNIEFDVDGNISSQDLSDRHQFSAPATNLYTNPYIGEVIGKINYTNSFTNTINLQYTTIPLKLFRLPVSRPCHLEVEYLYQSTNQKRLRRGKLSIVVNPNDLDTDNKPKLEMIDDYDYFGVGMDNQLTSEDIHLIFSATTRKYTLALSNRYTLELRYVYDGENTQSLGDQAKLTYTYKILS
jgi:Pectate lyase superfamily protein/Major tropism determinant N-terminal domain